MESLQSVRQRKGKRQFPDPAIGGCSREDEKKGRDGLPNSVGYAALLMVMLALHLLRQLDFRLPDQVTLDDEYVQTDRFIGQRAESFLRRLTSIGTRVVGSYENEVLAVDLIKREISFVVQQKNKIHTVETDIQKPTGSYYLSLKPHNFHNYYSNIQNIVVRLRSKNSTSNSVLLNCHYDTVPESPGASDNGLNCAVLLEILTKLSKSKKPLHNTVIFLFNGAEENPLQASHGFITQHKWSKDVKVVINLDSAGAGGGEILFQTSPNCPWLVETYARVAPHPLGGVYAEELFQRGLIPSDTDFRIFRDFGKVPGLDFAHAQNGYIYHTRFDTMNFIAPGVYQNTGDNILALTKAFSSAEELGRIEDSAGYKVVYFDVFRKYMVVYSESFAAVTNVTTAILSALIMYRTFTIITGKLKPLKEIAATVGIQLMSMLLSMAMVVLVAKMLDSTNSSLSWYTRHWFLFPLYVFPFILGASVLPLLTFVHKKEAKSDETAVRFMSACQFIWSAVLLIGTLFRIRSACVILVILLPSTVAAVITTASRRHFSPAKYIIANLVCMVPSVAFILQMATRLVDVLVPMAARMGPHAQPEILIGGLVGVLSLLSFSQWIPLILKLRTPKVFLVVVCLLHVAMILVVRTPYGFPYSGDVTEPSLQRFYILHCERTFHDNRGNVRKSDSGFFVQSLDRNNINYVMKEVPELQTARSASEECISELNCGVPVFTSRFINPAPFGYWVEAYAPVIHHPTNLVVTSQVPLDIRTRRISFAVTVFRMHEMMHEAEDHKPGYKGPDHITIVVSPKTGVRLTLWTFEEGEPKSAAKWGERDIYMIYYSHGLMGGTLEFSLDLEVNQEVVESDSVLDIAVIGHYMHDKRDRTEEFTQFLSKFPKWSHLTAWTTTYKSWAI